MLQRSNFPGVVEPLETKPDTKEMGKPVSDSDKAAILLESIRKQSVHESQPEGEMPSIPDNNSQDDVTKVLAELRKEASLIQEQLTGSISNTEASRLVAMLISRFDSPKQRPKKKEKPYKVEKFRTIPLKENVNTNPVPMHVHQMRVQPQEPQVNQALTPKQNIQNIQPSSIQAPNLQPPTQPSIVQTPPISQLVHVPPIQSIGQLPPPPPPPPPAPPAPPYPPQGPSEYQYIPPFQNAMYINGSSGYPLQAWQSPMVGSYSPIPPPNWAYLSENNSSNSAICTPTLGPANGEGCYLVVGNNTSHTQPTSGQQPPQDAWSRRRVQRSKSSITRCQQCGTTSTPEWRRGPQGQRTLCNACGLFHAKIVRRQGKEEAIRLLRERKQAPL